MLANHQQSINNIQESLTNYLNLIDIHDEKIIALKNESNFQEGKIHHLDMKSSEQSGDIVAIQTQTDRLEAKVEDLQELIDSFTDGKKKKV